MNHHILKSILVILCLVIPPSTPAWSGKSASSPPSAQFAQTPGYYPAPPGYYTGTPEHGYAPARESRPGWSSGRRAYPAPRYTPPYGAYQPGFTPRTQTGQARPPYQAAGTADTTRERLQTELGRSHAELSAVRDELQQTRALLEDAGVALDRAHDTYNQAAAGNKALEAKLASARAERDTARERETELSIELMAAEKQLTQASERLEQLETRDATLTDEHTQRERLLAEREAQLAELKTLVESSNAEASGLRGEREQLLAEHEAQLAGLKTLMESSNAEASGLRGEREQLLSEHEAQLAGLKTLMESSNAEASGLRGEREQLLAERESQLAKLKALVESSNAEASDLRGELDTRDQQLALMKTEVQAAADALTQAQNESTAASSQRDEQASRQQACQAELDRLATRFDKENDIQANARQVLAEAEAAQVAVQAELTACNSARAAAVADLEAAQKQIEKLDTATTPAPAAAPAMGDSDTDGVADSDDLCPETPQGVSVGPTGCASNAPIILEGVSFHYDSHELSAESHAILDRVSAILRQQPTLRLEVAGHTDAQGNRAYNQWLSQQRATSVMDYLIDQGVNPDNLTARGYGAQLPIADNSNREGLARNRRVELRRLP